MQFDSWHSFIAMGGYGFYVWLAFGVTFAAMMWLLLMTLLDSRKLVAEVRKEAARQARIKAAQQLNKAEQP